MSGVVRAGAATCLLAVGGCGGGVKDCMDGNTLDALEEVLEAGQQNYLELTGETRTPKRFRLGKIGQETRRGYEGFFACVCTVTWQFENGEERKLAVRYDVINMPESVDPDKPWGITVTGAGKWNSADGLVP